MRYADGVSSFCNLDIDITCPLIGDDGKYVQDEYYESVPCACPLGSSSVIISFADSSSEKDGE